MLEGTPFNIGIWYLLFVLYLGLVTGSYIKLSDNGAHKYYLLCSVMPLFIFTSHAYKGIQHFKTDKQYSWVLTQFATVKLPISIGVIAEVVIHNEKKKKRKQSIKEVWRMYNNILDFKVMKNG